MDSYIYIYKLIINLIYNQIRAGIIYIYVYIYICLYIQIYIHIHIHITPFLNIMFSGNADGIRVVELEENFRMQWSKVIFVLQVSSYGRFRFGMPHLQLHHSLWFDLLM